MPVPKQRVVEDELEEEEKSKRDSDEARKRRLERSLEQGPQAWMLFGRLGVINYQNQLDCDSGGEITLKRSGPSVGGTRISFGIRRRF